MRQNHVPGHAVFVDFSGKRPHYVDQQTGEIIHVELFVAVLGYSNLTYAVAIPRQKLDHGQHLILSGPTGVGKTWWGFALGHQAIRRGLPVIYYRFEPVRLPSLTARIRSSYEYTNYPPR
jgi:hypothetical protein